MNNTCTLKNRGTISAVEHLLFCCKVIGLYICTLIRFNLFHLISYLCYYYETMRLFVIFMFSLGGVWGHGRLIEPPSRSSMWRFGYNSPTNYQDNELFCGGSQVFLDRNCQTWRQCLEFMWIF